MAMSETDRSRCCVCLYCVCIMPVTGLLRPTQLQWYRSFMRLRDEPARKYPSEWTAASPQINFLITWPFFFSSVCSSIWDLQQQNGKTFPDKYIYNILFADEILFFLWSIVATFLWRLLKGTDLLLGDTFPSLGSAWALHNYFMNINESIARAPTFLICMRKELSEISILQYKWESKQQAAARSMTRERLIAWQVMLGFFHISKQTFWWGFIRQGNCGIRGHSLLRRHDLIHADTRNPMRALQLRQLIELKCVAWHLRHILYNIRHRIYWTMIPSRLLQAENSASRTKWHGKLYMCADDSNSG